MTHIPWWNCARFVESSGHLWTQGILTVHRPPPKNAPEASAWCRTARPRPVTRGSLLLPKSNPTQSLPEAIVNKKKRIHHWIGWRENRNRKPSIFPWSFWGCPVKKIFNLNHSNECLMVSPSNYPIFFWHSHGLCPSRSHLGCIDLRGQLGAQQSQVQTLGAHGRSAGGEWEIRRLWYGVSIVMEYME